LVAQITTEQTSELGSKPRYMRKLLQLVKGRMESRIIDITLKFTLSALWNLTGLLAERIVSHDVWVFVFKRACVCTVFFYL
jgi:hypothetical protein